MIFLYNCPASQLECLTSYTTSYTTRRVVTTFNNGIGEDKSIIKI